MAGSLGGATFRAFGADYYNPDEAARARLAQIDDVLATLRTFDAKRTQHRATSKIIAAVGEVEALVADRKVRDVVFAHGEKGVLIRVVHKDILGVRF